MDPLDLTKRPPRPPAQQLDGIAFLPRAIDKTRAAQPGGALGAYFNEREGTATMSGRFYQALGIAASDFEAAVARARTDDDVARWLRERTDRERIARWNQGLCGARVGDLDPEDRAAFEGYHGGASALGDDVLIVDAIASDDRATFGMG